MALQYTHLILLCKY